jgi:DNA-directed RNA polymerase specialized sigma24 family protein
MYISTITRAQGGNGNEEAASRDMELVAAARAGSSGAFEELQNLYSRRLYNRIFSITRNREDAEDALQDTFLAPTLHSTPLKDGPSSPPG